MTSFEMQLATALVEVIPGDRGVKVTVAEALAPRLRAAIAQVALEQHKQSSLLRLTGRSSAIDEHCLYDVACAALRGGA